MALRKSDVSDSEWLQELHSVGLLRGSFRPTAEITTRSTWARGCCSLGQLIARLLFGSSATDPLTFVGVATILTAVAFLACWIPAGRAAKVDPMVALRHE